MHELQIGSSFFLEKSPIGIHIGHIKVSFLKVFLKVEIGDSSRVKVNYLLNLHTILHTPLNA